MLDEVRQEGGSIDLDVCVKVGSRTFVKYQSRVKCRLILTLKLKD
jgi:hypothetical protein